MTRNAFDVGSATSLLRPGRPLVVVDADEVILRFVKGFDNFLRARRLFLDLSTYRLHGNLKRMEDDQPILDVEVTALLEEFRHNLDSLEMVEGAREAIEALTPLADIVVLTNITPEQAEPRRRNLAAHGFDVPLVANTGPKGPAVKALTARAGSPVFFVDDIPQHHASVAQAAPEVLRIHLVGDERLRSVVPIAQDANFRAEDWRDAEAFMRSCLARAR